MQLPKWHAEPRIQSFGRFDVRTIKCAAKRLKMIADATRRSVDALLVANTEDESLNGKMQTPLQVAEAGGRHSGFLSQRIGKTPDELLREAKTLRQRAAKHQDKITKRIGYSKVSDDPVIQARADAGRTRHLQREIGNFTQQAEICEELAQKKAAGGP